MIRIINRTSNTDFLPIQPIEMALYEALRSNHIVTLVIIWTDSMSMTFQSQACREITHSTNTHEKKTFLVLYVRRMLCWHFEALSNIVCVLVRFCFELVLAASAYRYPCVRVQFEPLPRITLQRGSFLREQHSVDWLDLWNASVSLRSCDFQQLKLKLDKNTCTFFNFD